MKIRTKLTLALLTVGVLFPLAISIVSYLVVSREITQKTVNQLTSTASSQQQKINTLLQARHEEATKLVNQFDLQSALAVYNADQQLGQQQISDILLTKKISNPDIQAIDMVDLNGVVISSTIAGNQAVALEQSEYAVDAGQESRINIRQDPRDGINKLYITYRVNVNKEQAGYLKLVFRIDNIIAAVQDYTGLGDTGETIVAAQDDSQRAVSLFPLRFDTDGSLQNNLSPLGLFNERQEPGSYHYAVDYRDQDVIIAPRSIGFADWIIATKIDSAEALSSITQLRNTLIAVVITASVGISIMSLYFTRLFTQPILQVAAVAQQIGKGDFASRAPFKRQDEIGSLAESVNTMGQGLEDFVSNIKLQRNRLAVVINSTAESILAIDQQERIVLANNAASRLSSRSIDAILGHKIEDIFSWKKDMQPHPINYSQATAQAYTNLTYANAAGDLHYVKVLVAPAGIKGGSEGPQTIVTIHDETESRELENMKVDFVSMAAHELRTPLAATRGYLELAHLQHKKQSTSSSTDDYLQRALKSTDELASLINNLLGVTRIERGTVPFSPEKVDLAADLQEAIQTNQANAQDKNITLSYQGPPGNCFVVADYIGLREVVNNLLANAIKYTEQNGNVEVRLAPEGNSRYRIDFIDNGIGIPRHALKNLFTKFYRVKSGLNSGSTGTGLGLFLSKSIIERHGGKISVESEINKGSTFTVILPKFNIEWLNKLKKGEQTPQTQTRDEPSANNQPTSKGADHE